MPSHRRVLIVGGSFAGLCAARDLGSHFLVTVVDAKEYFEYTPGVLRAFVKPSHLDALTFTLHPVIEYKMGCKFVWGEVKSIDGANRTASIKPIFSKSEETIDFDFCIIASGCGFGPFHKWGESLWFPTIHEQAIPEGSWPQFDERFLEGRRRHILDEHESLKQLDAKGATILVVGAGFIGVEWVTELQYYFPNLKLTIMDMLPKCLGPLPDSAAKYCDKYMVAHGIKTVYGAKYAPDDKAFWTDVVKMPNRADKIFVCIGVKATNWFMPEETRSTDGPMGGGWILMDKSLAVTTRDKKRWSVDEKGHPRIYAIGDCNRSAVAGELPMIPKISYPGEEEAVVACKNIWKVERMMYLNRDTDCFGSKLEVHDMHWPWGAGMFATSLGPHTACFVAGANWEKNSGYMVLWGRLSALQKEIIETTKVNECAMGIIGRLIWHFVHHTPVHIFGGGPLFGY